MAEHKYASMIKAKADNMALVVLRKHHEGDWIEVADQSEIRIKQNGEYFLCLPQHKDACLHWLNGGDLEFNSEFMDEWTEYEPFKNWGIGSVFMQDDYKIRIKSRKEKLWIAVKTDKHENLGGCRKVRICSHAFVNKQDAVDYLDLDSAQLVEIEVEV